MKFILTVIGLVMVIEGLPYFAFPEKMKQILKTMLEMPESSLRVFGFVLMSVGVAIVCFMNMGGV